MLGGGFWGSLWCRGVKTAMEAVVDETAKEALYASAV
jgi:hypothetical protein